MAANFTRTILQAGRGNAEAMTGEEREEIRRQWERFSPESRRKIFQEIARHQLQEIRRRTADMTPEERSLQINRAIEQMRSRRQHLSPSETAELRDRIQSEEGREMVRNILAFYQDELSAEERAELDPLVHEWLYQLEELTGSGR